MQVIVIGAGVAGTTTAIALRRQGINVDLFETYPQPAGEVGSFLSLAANGLRGLAAIDCLDRVAGRGFPVERQRLWSGSGALLGDVARGRRAEDPQLSVTLMRAHLVGELRAAAVAAGVTVRTDTRLVSATRLSGDSGMVRAEFADGATATADLLIGADGIWSTTRTIVDTAAPRPTYAGLFTVSGVARDESVPTDGAFNMVFGRHGVFIHLGTPTGEVWWQAQVASPTPPDRDDLDPVSWRDRLAELYRNEPKAAAIIRASAELHRPTPHHTLAPVSTWHRDNIVLVGDAVHPVGAGQGASMAIEDAIVLADALGRRKLSGAPVPAALDEYQRARAPRVARMMKLAADNRDTKQGGPLYRAAQRVIMPIVMRHVYERATGWLYDWAPHDQEVGGAR